jgi:hypothetical protein
MDFLQPEDFDEETVYDLNGLHVCGACIRAMFGCYTDVDLREAKRIKAECDYSGMGCVTEEPAS